MSSFDIQMKMLWGRCDSALVMGTGVNPRVPAQNNARCLEKHRLEEVLPFLHPLYCFLFDSMGLAERMRGTGLLVKQTTVL